MKKQDRQAILELMAKLGCTCKPMLMDAGRDFVVTHQVGCQMEWLEEEEEEPDSHNPHYPFSSYLGEEGDVDE